MMEVLQTLQALGWDVRKPRRKGEWWRIEGFPIAEDQLAALSESGLRASEACFTLGGKRRKGAVAATARACGENARAIIPLTEVRFGERPRHTSRTLRLMARLARIAAAKIGGTYLHSPACSSDSHYAVGDQVVVRFSLHPHDDWPLWNQPTSNERGCAVLRGTIIVSWQPRRCVRWAH